ncbi:outer membrane beta-barrel protein [Fluviicola sp.]|jgi:outer membrane protein W|uniref:outer membrane beta-barrel protein n=1 Tax=Fluviicola sp. TaxID=1917219 RepID=UPI00281CF823|nr:OmpW family outer membrane protein [Fluviicola sp.]MDR0803040.1 outer membrane beta-barrel protein [Fluviicola sp.]
MKKLSLLLGGVILSTAVMAQKPTEGAPMSLEGTISGLANFGFNNSSVTNLNGTTNGNTTASIVTPGLRFRYFVTDNIAVRLSLGFNSAKRTENFYQNENDNSGGSGTYVTKLGTTTIGIGAEYHFKGTGRLSPYAGLDINFGMGKFSTDGKQTDGNTWVSADYAEKSVQKTGGFGIGLVGGTDYYFVENFYLGVELGLGFNSYTMKAGTSSVTIAGVTAEVKGNEMKQSGFANNVFGQFRLGWRF